MRSVNLRVPGPNVKKTQTNNDRFRSPRHERESQHHPHIFWFLLCVVLTLLTLILCRSSVHRIYLISFNKNWFCGHNKRRERWIVYWWKKSKCSKLMINWHPQFLKQLFERSSNIICRAVNRKQRSFKMVQNTLNLEFCGLPIASRVIIFVGQSWHILNQSTNSETSNTSISNKTIFVLH